MFIIHKKLLSPSWETLFKSDDIYEVLINQMEIVVRSKVHIISYQYEVSKNTIRLLINES
jgi:hypothetical protein